MSAKKAALQYRPDIDGLRTVAVVPVVLSHAGAPGIQGGFVGVDVFFVISGFLITTILRNEMAAGTFSIARFYERRARRLLPALLVVILACIPFAWNWMLPEVLQNFGQSIVATLLFSNNILLAVTSGYWDLESGFKPLLHTWSLGVEEQFYIVFPLLLLLAWRFGSKFQLGLVIGLGLVSLSLAEYGWRHFPAKNFYLPTSRAWELMVGAGCAYLPRRIRALDGLLALTGLVGILVAVIFYTDQLPFPSFFTLLPVIGAAFVLVFGRPNTMCHAILSLPPMIWIGLISYSLYLWHQPLFAFARIYSLEPPTAVVMSLLTVLSVILAWLSWRYVEQPFRNPRKIRLIPMVATLTIPTVCLLAFGLDLHVNNGRAYRVFPNATGSDDLYIAYNERIYGYRSDTFPQNGKQNILVAGNSVARDFANILIEAGLIESRNLVYRSDLGICAGSGGIRDDLRPLLASADIIVLLAEGSAECAQRTLVDLRTETLVPVVIVGPKNFGYNMNPFVRVPIAERPTTWVNVPADILAVNEDFRRTIPADRYLDLIGVIGDGHRLPVFDASGLPLSQDRVHLTRYGAVYFAERLDAFPQLMGLFEAGSNNDQ